MSAVDEEAAVKLRSSWDDAHGGARVVRPLDGPPPGLTVPGGRNDNARALRAATFDEVEVRDNGESLEFIGHAAVFDRLSDDLGGFRERIMRGAFQKVLDDGPDVRFLSLDHGGLPLARTSSGTMELREDPTGLRVYANLAPIQASRDLKVLTQRRDLTQMSFGFSMGEGGNEVWTDEDGQIVRTITSFGRLYDVSPVSFPAYSQTDAQMRSVVCGIQIVDGGKVQEKALRGIAWKIHRGERDASVEERSEIDAAFALLDTVSPWIAERAFRAASQEPDLRAAIPGKRAEIVLQDADSGGPPYRLAARKRRLRTHGVQMEARADTADVALLESMIGLGQQYMDSAEDDEGDDDSALMAGVLSVLNDLLADELSEPS